MRNLTRVFKKAHSVIIVSHDRPDGDALGSALALGMALVSLGKKVDYFNKDAVPRNLSFLASSKKISSVLKRKEYDVACIVDCDSPERVGGRFAEFAGYKKLVVIDHHRPRKKKFHSDQREREGGGSIGLCQ